MTSRAITAHVVTSRSNRGDGGSGHAVTSRPMIAREVTARSKGAPQPEYGLVSTTLTGNSRPFGAVYVTSSPGFLPRMAEPSGDFSE